ncbi:DUF5621 domain-containing protein [uncultured Legionella sp.]|uniref:DUF5621 domain-containing protein n=1 Tax=uncultured Legionella sp. TaxID=210934 RepID=UPI002615FD62|nr:DUF5621 domain-containing protein [uncultured Legionella sp.]
MAIFTVFCYGTGENHRKTNNIISQFSKACNEENSIHVDGPRMLGTEVKPNAARTTEEIIKWLNTQADDSHSINMAGFSRGSITSIYIANNLKKREMELEAQEQQLILEGKQLDAGDKKLLTQLQKINLNLFLIDPVAGMSDKSKMDGRVIPDNVKSCVTVYQTDEMRRDFKPQDLTRLVISSPQTTKLSMLPMYGNHSDTTKIKNDKMTAGPQILWHSLYQFLTQHGTTFQGDKKPQIVYSNDYREPTALQSENPSAKELLNLFSLNHEERDAYLKSGMTSKLVDGIPTPRIERTLNKHLRFYVKNADFFTNQLERELFKITYPKTFNYLFERNQVDIRFPNDRDSSPEKVAEELAILKQDNPRLFARLESRGVREADGNIHVGKPRGIYHLEPCATVQQMFPNLVTNDLITQQAPQMNKLAQLEMDVYRLTFRYQREKEWYKFSHDRPENERVKDIRNDINKIINYSKEDNNTKYKRILDKVEQHYKELMQSASSSDLVPMLKGLLDRNGRQYIVHDPGLVRDTLSATVHVLVSTLRETIGFVGNLGYVGGDALFSVGHALQNIGRRTNEMLGTLGYNPLKYVASALAYTFEGIGFAIKNSFGLKPLTAFIVSGLNGIRDALNSAIRDVKIEKANAVTQQVPDVAELPVALERQEPELKRPITIQEHLNEPLLNAESEPQSEANVINKTVDARRQMQEQRAELLAKANRTEAGNELDNVDNNRMQLS